MLYNENPIVVEGFKLRLTGAELIGWCRRRQADAESLVITRKALLEATPDFAKDRRLWLKGAINSESDRRDRFKFIADHLVAGAAYFMTQDELHELGVRVRL